MYFIQVVDPTENSGYICANLNEVKSTMKDILLSLNNGVLEDDSGEPIGWTSLYDEIEDAQSFVEIANIIKEFVCANTKNNDPISIYPIYLQSEKETYVINGFVSFNFKSVNKQERFDLINE